MYVLLHLKSFTLNGIVTLIYLSIKSVVMSGRNKDKSGNRHSKPKVINDSQSTNPADSQDYDFDPNGPAPPGVHDFVFKFLVRIEQNTKATKTRLDELEERCDDYEGTFTSMKNEIKALNSQVEILTGRLLRSEAHCTRLENDLTDMKAHSMGKNIIIHSKDNKEMPMKTVLMLPETFLRRT